MGQQSKQIQWFPGHMAKTRRLMRESLPLVDLVVELLDARIPVSSQNPEIDKIAGKKPRLLLLNKSDYADEAVTNAWRQHYLRRGLTALPTDCRSGKGLSALMPAARSLLSEQLARLESRGMGGRPLRMMIVGIPNVGKSSLINRLAGARRTKTEDRPGVTRGRQWVKLEGGAELLDMPGVLWPKFEDATVSLHLAFTGAIKDEILDVETLAARLLEELWLTERALLTRRYRLEPEDEQAQKGHLLLERVAVNRGMLLPGGIADTLRAATAVLDEFRGGVIGRISLERPKDYTGKR
jgi:ribosome biogenesis GTPase A